VVHTCNLSISCWIGAGVLISDLSYNQLTGEIPFDIEFPQLATL